MFFFFMFMRVLWNLRSLLDIEILRLRHMSTHLSKEASIQVSICLCVMFAEFTEINIQIDLLQFTHATHSHAHTHRSTFFTSLSCLGFVVRGGSHIIVKIVCLVCEPNENCWPWVFSCLLFSCWSHFGCGAVGFLFTKTLLFCRTFMCGRISN